MRLEQMRFLIATAETLSFSKASETLFLTPQALSRSMGALEKELGVNLFVRYATGVQLTPEGEIVLDMARKMIRDYDTAMNQLQEKKRSKKTTIYLYSHPIQLEAFLNQIILKYKSLHPNVSIVIKDIAASTMERIQHRQNDASYNWICFASTFDGVKPKLVEMLPKNSIFETDDCLRSRYVACLNKEHVLAKQKEVSMKMLQECTMVRFSIDGDEENENAEDVIDIFFKEMQPPSSYRVNSLSSWIAAVENGIGPGLIDQLVCGNHSRCKNMFNNITLLPIVDSVALQHFFASKPDRSPEVEDFIQFALNELRSTL